MPASVGVAQPTEQENHSRFHSKKEIEVDEKQMNHADSTYKREQLSIDETVEELSYFAVFVVYWCYLTMLIAGRLRNYVNKILIFLRVKNDPFAPPPGYAPLFKELEQFWLTRVYQRIRDLFERTITGVPGAKFQVLNRASDDENASFYFTGGTTECLNFGSYNYLGFAQTSGPITDSVAESIKKYSYGGGSSRLEAGKYDVINELEETIARHVGKPSAMAFGMGYATNSTTLPAICGGKGCLIISDTLNHASIVAGARDSGARILVFKHNNPKDLEKVLRDSIVEGQPRTRRPWKKITIIVEGIYSMEGEICRLPEIVAVKKKYKAYLYVDEAHSIGALGKTGRGVCEQTGVNPADVDILMGTFTKAFGSVGGYIASHTELIDHLRHLSYGNVYATTMSPPCAQQALGALRVIMGEDGTTDGINRINRLKENSNFFRTNLAKLNFHVVGDRDSPVVIMMMYHPAKLAYLSRKCLAAGIAVVSVGFPVTPLLLARVRFCLSASHTIEQLQYVLKVMDELGDVLLVKHKRR
jgi:serine palmitoyltransferase